jgi:hypothetical protein
MAPVLQPEHAKTLARLLVTDEILEAAGVRSVTDAEARETLGINHFLDADLTGIFFPYRCPVTGNRVGGRIRLDSPLPNGGKYISESGCRHFFFPPMPSEYLKDTHIPVVIVEAEKSALAIRSLNSRSGRTMLPIAVGGCWGWKRKNGKRLLADGRAGAETGPGPDLDLVVWQGRCSILAFDSNASENTKVQRARSALAQELQRRGAKVLIAEIPSINGVNGPDDFIAIYHDGAMLAALDSARSMREVGSLIENEFECNRSPIPDFPESAWRGVFGQYRDRMRKSSEASDAYHFLALWTAAGNALGRRLYFSYGMRLYPNVYGIAFGPSGDFKTSACRWIVEITEAVGLRAVRGIGSGEGIASGLSEQPTLFFLEEFTALIRQGNWQGSTLLPTLTEIFDCPEKYEREYRKNPISLAHPICSILAATTEAWFWRDVKESDFEGGFGNRFVYFSGTPNPPIALPKVPDVQFVINALKELKNVGEQEAQLERDAVRIWQAFYSAWRSEKLAPLEAAATQRIPAYNLKLAMTYAALEGTLPVIRADQLKAALLVGNYAAKCMKHLIAQRFCGTNVFRELENRILAAVVRQPQNTIIKRQLYRGLARHYSNAEQFNRVFDSMVRAGTLFTRVVGHGRVNVSTEPFD